MESQTTIVAFKAKGLGVLIADGESTVSPFETVVDLRNNKTIRLNSRIHFATAGSASSRINLADALSRERIQAFESGYQAAEYVTNYINRRFVKVWKSTGGELRIVLVSNVDGPKIFEIGKVDKGLDSIYVMFEFQGEVLARGTGAKRIRSLIAAFPQNMDARDSFNYAFKCVRLATLKDWASGGDITMIRIYENDSHTTVFCQEDPKDCTNPYVMRRDYRNAPDGLPRTFNLARYPAMIDLDFALPAQDQQVPGQNHP